MPSSTTENYLKAIYALAERDTNSPLVRLGELATELNLTPGTITTMIRSLSERDLVIYQPRVGVKLTQKGKREALLVLRRHRLIELFLVEVMKMDWSEVHEDAEALEHAVSDKFLAKMDEMMGYPTEDPHGDPIPVAGADMPATKNRVLSDVEPGAYQLSRVNDQDPEFLAWLSASDLRPGTRLVVSSHDPHSGVLMLQLQGAETEFPIGVEAAKKIRVKPVADNE
ncbi:MAG: metal-dependent transcriptional regulator [Kiritimatiellia bacterium]